MSVAPKMPVTSTNLDSRLASILGATRIQSDPATLAGYAIDEVLPSVIAKPASADEAAEIVRFAVAERLAIIPVGSRSKLGIGMPPARYDIALDMTAINQIAHYDPGDLTLSVDAGCTLLSLSVALLPQKQFLPLFPFAFRPLATIAGTIASGVDSHLRQFYGTARDFLIGAEFIDGTGAQCKSGGRVVKNVTGYDLHKLLIGSLGTLGVITRLNFRTFPLPTAAESQETFVASFSNAQSAIAFRQEIAASPFTPHAVEILSPEIGKIFCAIDASVWEPPSDPLGAGFSPSCWHVLVLFHGTPELCTRYRTALTQFSESAGALSSFTPPGGTSNDSNAYSGEAKTLNLLTFGAIGRLRRASRFAAVFKIAQLPAKLADLFAALAIAAEQASAPHALCAHGTGTVHFALLPRDESHHLAAAQASGALTPQEVADTLAGMNEQIISDLAKAANAIFALCAKQNATASIQFCPTALKRKLNIFGPSRPDAPAMRRLKSAFDPHDIFAPGRMPL
jgi:FAD/FMN-containing dehydrogenase